MTEQDTAKRRFEELLPWYVNGTLNAADAEWVANYLREHPEGQAELWWHQSLRDRMRDNAPEVRPDAGFERLLTRIRIEAAAADRAAAAARPATAATAAPGAAAGGRARPAMRSVHAPGIGERLRDFLASFQLTPRFALAAALVVVQAGFIGKLLVDQRELEAAYTEVRSAAGRVQLDGTLIRVSFKADARETDIRHLLVSIGGTVVEGPSQLGDYVVKVPTERASQAAEQLVGSSVIEAAAVLGEAAKR
jgi:hypothetical protein